MFRPVFFFALVVYPAFAQDPRSIPVIRGAVTSNESLSGNHLTVNIVDSGAHRTLARAFVSFDGTFEIHDLPPGTYTVDLLSQGGEQILSQTLNLSSTVDRIEFKLPEHEKNTAPGTVSMRQLQHPLTKKATRVLAQAEKAVAAGEYAKSIEILRGAMKEESAVPYAHMNIGVAYIRMNQPALAIPELQEAAQLMPEDSVTRSNLAYSLLLTRHLDAAEVEARHAVQLDKSNAKARWVLGSILLSKGQHIDEAVEDLHLASREMPKARMMLVQFYERAGQKDAAARELREFLPQASADERVSAEQWLNKLVAK